MTIEEARKIIIDYKESELLSYWQIAGQTGVNLQTVRNFLKGGTPIHRNWIKLRAYAKQIVEVGMKGGTMEVN